MRSIKKDKSINEYLLEIKKIVDSLAAIDSPISDDDHIEAILDGLPEDFDSFITSVTLRLDPYSVDDIEALLLAQEECFEKHRRSNDNLVHAHTVSGPSQSSNLNVGRGKSDSNSRGGFRGVRQNFWGGFNSNNHGRNFNARGASRFNWNKNFLYFQAHWNHQKPQCQICGETGHPAIGCWHRFN